jgi:hypothetical protein
MRDKMGAERKLKEKTFRCFSDICGEWGSDKMEEYIGKVLEGIGGFRWHPYWKPKRMLPHARVTDSDVMWIKETGIYIPPPDAAYLATDHVDINRHGMPRHGAFAILTKDRDPMQGDSFTLQDEYLQIDFIRSVSRMPQGWIRRGAGEIYRDVHMLVSEHGNMAIATYFTVDQGTGKIVRCEETHNKHKMLNQDILRDHSKAPTAAGILLGSEGESEYVWNVVAQERDYRVRFGVHEEQIQSLFYARDLPLSETGRKRPILHWVRAHERMVRRGTEVGVKEHLRGTTEFEMHGTKFTITNPPKAERERERRRQERSVAAARAKIIAERTGAGTTPTDMPTAPPILATQKKRWGIIIEGVKNLVKELWAGRLGSSH